MSVFAASLNPGRALGILVLGASLHDILTRLKAEPLTFPKIDLIYSPTRPVTEPVVVGLPQNGLRLRFDGPEQRLRLIEVLDFSKSKLTFKGNEISKSSATDGGNPALSSAAGPNFRHVYHKLIGPAYPGEYIGPEDGVEHGIYVLSYPGIAFSFPVLDSAWSPSKDFVTLLSSSSAEPASSLAVFAADSWPAARNTLYTSPIEDPRNSLPQMPKTRDTYPDETGIVRLFGAGRVEITRPWSIGSFYLTLGETTPQELVIELGPPDAIYRKLDQRLHIHKRTSSNNTNRSRRPSGLSSRSPDDLTDTDQSSNHAVTDASEEEDNEEESAEHISGECFYNYFHHGFDILISHPTTPSPSPPSLANESPSSPRLKPIGDTSGLLVATKIILHSNVPGSYSFNRHRRCRWEIAYLRKAGVEINSECQYSTITNALRPEWKSIYASEAEASQRSRGMVLNRGWGDSPGSSVELLGGWEETAGGNRPPMPSDEDQVLGNTTLYGFPGLVFEVLKNGIVAGLTVF